MIPFGNPMIGHNGGPKIDDVFATDLVTTTTASQEVPISIKADMVWNKVRDSNSIHNVTDSLRPGTSLNTAANSAPSAVTYTTPDGVRKFATAPLQGSNVFWSFRKAKKFYTRFTYTGNGSSALVLPHDLGIKPGLIVIKAITAGTASNWYVGLAASAGLENLLLNSNGASVSQEIKEATDTTITVGGTSTNVNGRQYIAYLFAEDPSPTGLIRCGSYVGNTASLPFVNLGWEPQWLLIKAISAGGSSTYDWVIYDNKRSPANTRTLVLRPNATSVENAIIGIDFTSTGFQIRTASNQTVNQNGQTYLYMAIRKGKN